MHFVARGTPIDDIDGKSYKTELKRKPQLFKQLYKIQITPLVIYGLGGVHTHILWRNESDYKKPDASRPVASVHVVQKSCLPIM